MVAFAKQFDPTGNWTNFKQDTDADSDWELDQARAHNKANEIATIAGDDYEVAHDRAGNMVRAPKPSDWADHYHFEYDAWNRLVTVYDADGTTLVAGYDYDGLNRRVIKETYTAGSLAEMRHYYYSNQWQVLEERVQQCYGSSGSASAPESLYPDRQFVWGLRYVNDLILRDRDTDANETLDERLYVFQDPNWNVVAIANTSGDVQERYAYTAFGKPKYLTTTFGDRAATEYDWTYLFTGRMYDSETGLYDYRHRIYHSLLGRFVTKDPIGYLGGINLYRYCRNNPLTNTDPSGLKESACQKVLAELQGGTLDNRVSGDKNVEIAVGCNVHIFCSDDCGKGAGGALGGSTFVANGYVNICLSNAIEDENVLKSLIIHETTHAAQLIAQNKNLCHSRDPYIGDNPDIPPLRGTGETDPNKRKILCKQCVKWERPAYKRQCRYLYPTDCNKQTKCVKAGLYASCGHVCDSLKPPKGK